MHASRRCPARQPDGYNRRWLLGAGKFLWREARERRGLSWPASRQEWPRPRPGTRCRARGGRCRGGSTRGSSARCPGTSEPVPVVFVPGLMGSQLLRPDGSGGLAQPRQRDRPPRPAPARHAAVPARPRRPAPRPPRRDRRLPAARVRVHGVRRLPRPDGRRGVRARPRQGPPLRGLHLRLAARRRRERARPRAAARGPRRRDARPRREVPHRRPQHGRRSSPATTCATAARSRAPGEPVRWLGARRTASLVQVATPNAGGIPALGAILSRRARRLLVHDARRLGRAPHAVGLPAAAAGRHRRPRRLARLRAQGRPAGPGDVGAVRLGAVRAVRRRRHRGRAGVRHRGPRARARRPRGARPAGDEPCPVPCTCSAATACSPRLARARARARAGRRRGPRRAARASRTSCSRPATGASHGRASSAHTSTTRPARSPAAATPETTQVFLGNADHHGLYGDPGFESLLLRLLLRADPAAREWWSVMAEAKDPKQGSGRGAPPRELEAARRRTARGGRTVPCARRAGDRRRPVRLRRRAHRRREPGRLGAPRPAARGAPRARRSPTSSSPSPRPTRRARSSPSARDSG